MTRVLVQWIVALSVSVFAMGFVLAGAARAQEAAGDWHGVITAQGAELRIGLSLKRDAAGALSGQMFSPDQTPQGFPLAEVKAEGGKLSFEVPSIQGHYEATWDAAKRAWTGSWSQSGVSLPLVLTAGSVPPQARNQEPAKPYPYRDEPVKVASVPGVTLACTVTVPPGKGPFPGAVLITGSGAQDRDEALLGHRPFLVLADYLTRRGVAVLRCDDRGYAQSTGDFASATSLDFAMDTEAEATALRARHDVDPSRVGLIGHSEGGMIAPMVAAKDPKIAFIVLMAGPGAPIRELMKAQREAIGRTSGVSAETVAKNEVELTKLDQAVAEADTPAAAEAVVTRIMKADAPNMPAGAIGVQAKLLSSAWYRYFISYDPRVALGEVKVPILAVDGSKDTQVVASLNLPAIREATRANHDVTIVELPGLNHLFQTAGTGSPTEYGKIEETIAPIALSTIGDWVVAHTRR